MELLNNNRSIDIIIISNKNYMQYLRYYYITYSFNIYFIFIYHGVFIRPS